MIPRILHWIWLGPRKLPEKYSNFIFSWLKNHPGWRIYVWTDDNLPTIHNSNLFHSIQGKQVYGTRSDLLRYEVLAQYGGVYIDVDFESIRNIDTWLNRDALLVNGSDAGVLGNAIIGITPKHPFMQQVVNNFYDYYTQNKHKGVIASSGPLFLEAQAQLYKEKLPRVTDRKYFYPFLWNERYSIYPETYAAHHWGGTWR